MKTETTSIRATSRASVKVGDSFYTVEFCEERSVADYADEEELMTARQNLWETVNYECDNQIEEILKTYRK